jgi:hypothetical protein
MNRILKVLKKDNFIPELGYLVVTADGMCVYNGQVGIKYSRKLAGERLCSLAQKAGAYAIPEPSKFLRTVSVLEDISSVELIEKESAITIKFASKGSLKIPVVTNLHEQVPHLLLKWKTLEEANESGTEINSLWNEVHALTTNEGEALWGDVIGVYGQDGKLVSFDWGVYLHSDDMKLPDFYCPRSIVELGLKSMSHFMIDGDTINIVGHEVQYVFTGLAKSSVVNDMMHLKDHFEKGETKKVTLDFKSGLWKRAKLFASAILSLKVTNGEIFVHHDTWSECIGKTEAPDAEFVTRISLLSRWASGTFEHSISISQDGTWYLFGKTRGGLSFYAVLTDVAKGEIEESTEEPEVSVLPDIEEGKSLL